MAIQEYFESLLLRSLQMPLHYQQSAAPLLQIFASCPNIWTLRGDSCQVHMNRIVVLLHTEHFLSTPVILVYGKRAVPLVP